jgi:hypothetical protein
MASNAKNTPTDMSLIEKAKKVKGKFVSAKEYFAKRHKMGSAA